MRYLCIQEKNCLIKLLNELRIDSRVYSETKEIKWNIIRRWVNRSTDLSEFSYLNYIYSPDLMLYIDSDDSGDQFLIRKTLDQEVLLRFPEGILQPKFDHPKQVVKHFTWLSNRSFKVINHDSLEKIFEITPDNKLKTVGYGAVPMLMFDDKLHDEKYHYYIDRQY